MVQKLEFSAHLGFRHPALHFLLLACC